VDVMFGRRPTQRRKAARRPWWRRLGRVAGLAGLGLLARRLAVSERGRQARTAAKEQAQEQMSKARQKLAAARSDSRGTTTVAPPTGAPPGPVLAEVPKPPHDHDHDNANDGSADIPASKLDTATDTATAEPDASQ
jgi:hypothetical protein